MGLLERWTKIEDVVSRTRNAKLLFALQLVYRGILCGEQYIGFGDGFAYSKLVRAERTSRAEIENEAQEELNFIDTMRDGYSKLGGGIKLRRGWSKRDWSEIWTLNHGEPVFTPGFFEELREERYPIIDRYSDKYSVRYLDRVQR